MRFIGRRCHTALLFGGNDHWAPEFHIDDLKDLLQKGSVSNVTILHAPQLQHDFVCQPDTSVPIVVDFCVEQILRHASGGSLIFTEVVRSKL